MITFKQFLMEVKDWEKYYKKYSEEEKKSFSEPSLQNVEKISRVGQIVFDQQKGIGQVPLNANVLYEGFVGMMLPKDFTTLSYAPGEQQEQSSSTIKEKIKEGFAVGSPFLYLTVWKEKNGHITDDVLEELKVTGHEGRSRSIAINNIQPDKPIPVHFFIRRGKARDITPEIFEKVMTEIIPQGKLTPIKSPIKKIIKRD